MGKFSTTGQYFRICTDVDNDTWDTIPLKNTSDDCYYDADNDVTVTNKIDSLKAEIDTKQDASTAITIDNIANQTVKYAISAGSATNATHATSADNATNATNLKSSSNSWTADTVKTWFEDRYTKTETDTKLDEKLNTSGGTMTGDLTVNTEIKMGSNGIVIGDSNVMKVLRIQAKDDNSLLLAGGYGTNGNDDGYVFLLGRQVECWNTNQTSLTDISCHQLHYQEACAASSKLVKENIQDLTEEEAKKILDVDFVTFDYKECYGGAKEKRGVIAEQILNVIPSCVHIPENYKEENFDESKGMHNKVIGVDYISLIPYLGKMIQIQQKEINELKEKVANLK